MRTSAGIVLHRRRGGRLEVLLGHFGGPMWARRDDGAWTIPKGEHGPDEDPWDAACREFAEELGVAVPAGDVHDLGTVRQSSAKSVRAWAVDADLDPEVFDPERLATVELEWPPRSGRRVRFPELDRIAWFGLDEARGRIVRGQVELLDRLAAALDPAR